MGRVFELIWIFSLKIELIFDFYQLLLSTANSNYKFFKTYLISYNLIQKINFVASFYKWLSYLLSNLFLKLSSFLCY